MTCRKKDSSKRLATKVCLGLLLVSMTAIRDADADEDQQTPGGDYSAAIGWLGRKLDAYADGNPLMVAWLIDESESMKDDVHELSQLFPKLTADLPAGSLTAIVSFGDATHLMTKAPTSSDDEIRKALQQIPINRPEQEKMCTTVGRTVAAYSAKARARKLRLVVVVVTDESPSDSGDSDSPGTNTGMLEMAIQQCQKAEVPVFVLGPEAAFGNAFKQIRWVDPVYKLKHWIRMSCGPESALPERMLWNGLGAVRDNMNSGFGPYSQERLCRETGGSFFVLPTPFPQQDFQKRRAAMAGYEPEWSSRREYQTEIARSRFRKTCSDVILKLNPLTNRQLNLRQTQFSVEAGEFAKQGFKEFEKTAYALKTLELSILALDTIRDLRDDESSKRWQANYDLLYAQCVTYQAMLPQYLLALDRHTSGKPKPADDKHNTWQIMRRATHPVDPTAEEFARMEKALKLDESRGEWIDKQESARKRAVELLDRIQSDHPNTPWAAAARLERTRGFNVELRSQFHDPRYQDVGKRVKVPVF